MKSITFTLVFFATLISFGQTAKFDLVIKNARVFDSRTGTLSSNQTILIKDGIIAKVRSSQKKLFCYKNY